MTCYRETRYINVRHRYWWRKPFSLCLLKSRGTSSIRTFWQKPVKKGKKSMPISMTDLLRLETFVFLESLSKRNTYIYMIYHCDSNVSNLRIYSLSSVKHFFITFSFIGLTDTTLVKTYFTCFELPCYLIRYMMSVI